MKCTRSFVLQLFFIVSCLLVHPMPSKASPTKEQSPIISEKQAPFFPQAGLGLSLLPLKVTYAGSSLLTYALQSGFGAQAFLKAHPQVTLDLGVSLLLSTKTSLDNYFLYEIPLLLGTRIHFMKQPLSLKYALFSPYLLIASGIKWVQALTREKELLEHSLYFQASVGPGIEFRLRHDFSLLLDLTFMLTVRFDSPSQEFFIPLDNNPRPAMPSLQGGTQISLTAVGYF